MCVVRVYLMRVPAVSVLLGDTLCIQYIKQYPASSLNGLLSAAVKSPNTGP